MIAPDKCDMCGAVIRADQDALSVNRTRAGETVSVRIHELCFLRLGYKTIKKEAEELAALFAGVIHVLGGTVRIHTHDIRTGLARGPVTPVPDAGGFFTISLGTPPLIQVASVPVRPVPGPNGKIGPG